MELGCTRKMGERVRENEVEFESDECGENGHGNSR